MTRSGRRARVARVARSVYRNKGGRTLKHHRGKVRCRWLVEVADRQDGGGP